MAMTTNMDCGRVGELASEYVENALPGALARAVAVHEAGCEACRRDLSALRAVWAELDALPPVEPPLFFRENVLAAIERAQPQRRTSWQQWIPSLGRVALGTAATGLAVAAVAWTLLLPGANAPAGTRGATISRVNGGGGARPAGSHGVASAPRLVIAQAAVADPAYGPYYEFVPRLEGAQTGTVRIHLLSSAPEPQVSSDTARPAVAAPSPLPLLPVSPEKTPVTARFVLGEREPISTLRVAFGRVRADDCIGLYVYWTAEGAAHRTFLFAPVPPLAPDGSVAAPAADLRQTFALPPMSLPEVARTLAVRYGQAITLDNVPAAVAGRSVTVSGRNETLAEALARSLAGTGLTVSPAVAPESGLRIAPPLPASVTAAAGGGSSQATTAPAAR